MYAILKQLRYRSPGNGHEMHLGKTKPEIPRYSFKMVGASLDGAGSKIKPLTRRGTHAKRSLKPKLNILY